MHCARRRAGVGRVGHRHRLDDDRRAAADLDTSDPDADGFVEPNGSHRGRFRGRSYHPACGPSADARGGRPSATHWRPKGCGNRRAAFRGMALGRIFCICPCIAGCTSRRTGGTIRPTEVRGRDREERKRDEKDSSLDRTPGVRCRVCRAGRRDSPLKRAVACRGRGRSHPVTSSSSRTPCTTRAVTLPGCVRATPRSPISFKRSSTIFAMRSRT